ncbi:MAG: HNH endonuclease [Comamonadaceae bacterium]|nr:MAG: HNH endonuclease [Comamonadaceae bacterium]
MAGGGSIATAPQRVQMANGTRLQQAPRISATPRQRGRKWMKAREQWLSANPLCSDCQAAGHVTEAREVDHIVPLWKGGSDEPGNYASLCVAHHKVKTALETAERAKTASRGC